MQCAADLDIATHSIDQPFADRKAEAGATEATIDRSVALGEFGKEPANRFLGHANASVTDLKAQRGLTHSLLIKADAQRDSPAVGEPDGVSDDVDEHLQQPRVVSFKHQRGCST